MDAEVFGNFIQQRRKALGLTQSDLAEKLHVTAKAVSRWERGVGFPDIKLLQPLADALEITIVELMQSKLIEEDIPKEEAAALVSDTVNTIQEQGKLSRKKICKLVLGSIIIISVQIFLLYVYHFYDFEPEWVGVGIYIIAFSGGQWCHQALRSIITGEPMEWGKRRKILWTWKLVLSILITLIGFGLICWGGTVGGIGFVNREYTYVAGMFLMIVSGIYYITHAEEQEEQ